MRALFEPSVTRIQTADGRAVGGGLLVSECLVLTCAHVVAATLGQSEEIEGMLQGTVRLDFPLVAPGCACQAKVVHWYSQSDVAVLELDGLLPPEVQPVHLIAADDLWEHHFRAFGFPAGHEDGVWASGVLRGSTAAGWVQIEDVKETGYRVEPGFSGAPVWDEALGGVVGIVVAAERQAETKAAFVIPTQALLAAWPTLAQIHLDVQMEQLRAKRDADDVERHARRERLRVVNLRPLDVTHTFKDRVREAQALFEHLADSSVRFISVVGRGGMGKTALVSHVLADLEVRTPKVIIALEVPVSGIIYLSARSTGLGLERIYTDVGRMLGEPAASRLTARWAGSDISLIAKVEYLLEMLQDGLYVILLDNLEDVLTEGGDIAEEGLRLFVERCLAQPGGARLVVTSREEVRLPPAGLMGARCVPLRDGLPEGEAMVLLRDLDPQGDLGLRDAPEADLRRAAQLTRGVPRALELLAGILQEDLILRLSNLLDDTELFGEQVVEQLVAEGYRRLGEPERRVMEALAVFDRPVETTAIAYLLHPWYPGLNVQAALRRLVRGHFATVNRASGEFSLHPIDREYAYGQLLDSEEMEAYTRCNLELRAAEFYASIRKLEAKWTTIDDLIPQLYEFEHRARAEDYEGACRALEPIDADYLFLWGYYMRLVDMRRKLLERLTAPELQAVNLGRLGVACHELAQFDEAIGYYEKALSITRRIGDRRSEGIWLGYLGQSHRSLGRIRCAIELHEEALGIAREVGDRQSEGVWLGNLGRFYRLLGQIERAAKFDQEALTIAQQIGDHRSEGIWLGHLGFVYHALGQSEQAIRFHKEALSIACEIGHRQGEQTQLANLGLAYYVQGQLERAVKFYEEALIIAGEIGSRRGESYCLLGLGRAFLSLGDSSRAYECCCEACDLNVPQTSHLAMLALGITLLYRVDVSPGNTFEEAVALCQTMLSRTADLYGLHYALGTALVGQAVCDPRWVEEREREDLLTPALEEYRRALAITAAPGVVGDALLDLELIRAAGVEGLELAFELLEFAREKADA